MVPLGLISYSLGYIATVLTVYNPGYKTKSARDSAVQRVFADLKYYTSWSVGIFSAFSRRLSGFSCCSRRGLLISSLNSSADFILCIHNRRYMHKKGRQRPKKEHKDLGNNILHEFRAENPFGVHFLLAYNIKAPCL
jgi:hypothetical protein